MRVESNLGLLSQVNPIKMGDPLRNKKLVQSQNFVPSKVLNNKYCLWGDVVYLKKSKASLKNDKLLEMGVFDKNSHKIFNQLINNNNKNIIKSLNKIDTHSIGFGSRVERSRKIVKQHVAVAVAGGFIPSVAASAATLIGNEIIMTSRIGYEYGYRDLKRQLKTVFKGAFEGGKTSIMTIPLADKTSNVVVQQLAQIIQSSLTTTLAGSVSKYIPFVGLAVNSTVAAFATEDLGDKIVNYFEAHAACSEKKRISYNSNSDNSDSDNSVEKTKEKVTNREKTIDDIDCLKYKTPEEYLNVALEIFDNNFYNGAYREALSYQNCVNDVETWYEGWDMDYVNANSMMDNAMENYHRGRLELIDKLKKKWENQWVARLRLLEIIENNK